MKLWLDDIRIPPEGGWTWVTTVKDAIRCLETGTVEEISFDHDLGTKDDGCDVAAWIEMMAAAEKMNRIKWSIHSANPVGRQRISQAMESAERFWS